jgi:hypothetical protein
MRIGAMAARRERHYDAIGDAARLAIVRVEKDEDPGQAS